MKKRTTKDPAPDEAEDERPEESANGELDSWEAHEELKLQRILEGEDTGTARLELSRRGKNGRFAYLDVFPIDDWTPDRKKEIAEQWGGGDYKLRVRRAGGEWGPAVFFTIDGSVKPRHTEMDQAQLAKLMEANRKDDTGPVLLQMMQMQQAQNQQMIQQMQESSKCQVEIITAALSRPPPPPPPAPSEKMMELLLAKALQPQQQLDLDKVLSAFTKLKSLANSDKKTDDDDPDLFDRLANVLPSLLNMLGQVQLVPNGGAQAPQVPPRTVKPESSSEETTREETHEPEPSLTDTGKPEAPSPSHNAGDENRTALAAFLPQVIRAADGGTSPDDVALQISDAVTDEVFEALIELLRREDWLAILADAHEGVMVRSTFFESLRTELLRIDDESQADE